MTGGAPSARRALVGVASRQAAHRWRACNGGPPVIDRGLSTSALISMSRFFNYKSVADIATEARRLGIDLRFAEDFAPLFQPVTVGPLTAGNRWCVQPMEG